MRACKDRDKRLRNEQATERADGIETVRVVFRAKKGRTIVREARSGKDLKRLLRRKEAKVFT